MEKFTVKNCCFGDGIPKICVSITGRTKEEILEQGRYILTEAKSLERKILADRPRLDVVEFRADFYDNVCDQSELSALMSELRMLFSDRLLLFTYRTEEEGGELRHDRAESMLFDIYDWVLEEAIVDLIDIELMSGNYRVVRQAAKAHEKGIGVIISNHDFDKTPHNTDLMERFRNMQLLGGDLLKISVMPKNEFDVKRLMELTENIFYGRLHEEEIIKPVITMAMGDLGRISRISGKQTGSAMTFAAVGQESAPGQPDLEEMFRALM